MSSFLIVNGPRQGEMIEPDTRVHDGDYLYITRIENRFKAVSDTPIRYSCPTFVMTYHLIGEHAYYLGEELYVSPVIKEAEQKLSDRFSPTDGLDQDGRIKVHAYLYEEISNVIKDMLDSSDLLDNADIYKTTVMIVDRLLAMPRRST